ncbi:hypothetical protein EDC96DRAFT_420249, partial [Choanephora cucurbitarum]
IQEPVPFEDFKFSLDFPQDPFLQQSPTLDFAAPSTHAILDEHDQKAFSSFLDAFFMDSDTMPQSSFEHEQRRHSILQSLDEQKKKLQLNHEPQTIYLRSSDTLKTTKELLTEEEKKANHIASEQKRRSTIRHGFKELTELIPTLKNVNHSKSVVLFKAAEFIQNLEKRNKHLRHKLESLKLRTQSCSQSPPGMDQRRASSSSSTDNLPMETKKALMVHKTQQEELMLYQEQLQ